MYIYLTYKHTVSPLYTDTRYNDKIHYKKCQLDSKTLYPRCLLANTVNPLYTDTRHNDKIRYNDNLTGTKPSSWDDNLSEIMKEHWIKYFKKHMFWILRGDSHKYPNHMFCDEISVIILLIKDSWQQQIHFNGNIFRNKWGRCNDESLSHSVKNYKRLSQLSLLHIHITLNTTLAL